MSVPVSMATGQAVMHEPSAAQVSIPSYSYCSLSATRTGEPGGWRAISRRSTIRWRGVVVTFCDGHTASQKPHSMHLVTLSSTSGTLLRLRRCTPGSRLRTTPGARMPAGSASRLTSHISSVASGPHSRSTNGAMLIPVPCSALSEPSYLSTMSSTMSAMNAS